MGEARTRKWLQQHGELDMIICRWTCVDMSSANKQGKGLRGRKSNVFFAAREILRIARGLYLRMEFVFECTWFKEKHFRDWQFVTDTLGVEPVKLDAGDISAAWRKRAFWASFPILELLRRTVGPLQVLEEGRRPAWRWRDKLPTIMASGPQSWNQKDCVETWSGERWIKGPLRIAEVERIMGFGVHSTRDVRHEDGELSDKQRWKALGNAIHASVMCHIMVSALVTRGYITRDSHLIRSQPWTVDLDGPASPSWAEVLKLTTALVSGGIEKVQVSKRRAALEKTTLEGAPSALQKVRSGRVLKVALKGKKQSESKRMMQWAGDVKDHRGAGEWENLEWKRVYEKVDKKGVPKLQLMERKMGKDKPQLMEGMGLWSFIDTLALDLMMLSRAESTWKQYAAWYALYVEWGLIMEVNVEDKDVTLEVLSKVLIRSLVMMWLGGGYAASTMEIYATSVVTRVRDRGLGELRENVAIGKLMEGIKRKLGCAVTKKLPVEGHHVRALMDMEPPEHDGEAWTGSPKNIERQWMQTVAMVVLAWAAFLRCSEIINLQLCDLTWVKERMELCVRKAKADQLGLTAITELEYGGEESEKCLLTWFEFYLKEVLGGVDINKGCTKEVHTSHECPECGWVFPSIYWNGVTNKPINETSLRRRFKQAFKRLEETGVVPVGHYELMSVGSCRKGGCSGACAYGVRDVLRERHGRWGLTARKRLGATAEPEYNVQLSSERGLVVKALNALLNGWLPGSLATGDQRDSGASGAAVRQNVTAGRK